MSPAAAVAAFWASWNFTDMAATVEERLRGNLQRSGKRGELGER